MVKNLIINIGSNNQNYVIKDLAKKISSITGNAKVYVKESAQSDKRSYQVNFDLFTKTASPFFHKKIFSLQQKIS